MTIEQIKALPTLADLNKLQVNRIAALQSAGTYGYDSLRAIIAERDQIVARETVSYYGADGTDGYRVIYGNATERAAQRTAIQEGR